MSIEVKAVVVTGLILLSVILFSLFCQIYTTPICRYCKYRKLNCKMRYDALEYGCSSYKTTLAETIMWVLLSLSILSSVFAILVIIIF